MSLVTSRRRSRIPRLGLRSMIAVATVTALVAAALTATVVIVTRGPSGCPAATNPLGPVAVADPPYSPRLCELGAPSRVIGAGRLKGVSWRIVVTPPRPWSAYIRAGFDPTIAPVPSDKVICIFDVQGPSAGFSCQSWELTGPAGRSLAAGNDGNLWYAYLGQRVDHFLAVPRVGPELTAPSVWFAGASFTAFTLHAGDSLGVLTAYDAHGRQLAITTSP